MREFGIDAGEIDVEKFAASLEVYRPDGSPRPVEETPPLRALQGEIIKNQEEIIRTPGAGELRHRQVSSVPVRDAGGKIIGSVSVVHDITDRKKAEADLMKLSEEMAARNVELEYANKEMESFIYSISHDLRAPIRTMSGFAKVLHDDYAVKLDAQGQDYLGRIVRGSVKSMQLIDDLLHLSQISRQEVTRIETDLTKKASKIVEELREMNPDRKVEAVVQEGLTASVDPRLIDVVLSNLLSNAWKFTSKTEKARIEFGKIESQVPSLESRVPRSEPETRNTRLETVFYVKDNGAGFDPTYVEKMFWPFHRLHTEKEFEGTGIGLTIVERVIRRHGGRSLG